MGVRWQDEGDPLAPKDDPLGPRHPAPSAEPKASSDPAPQEPQGPPPPDVDPHSLTFVDSWTDGPPLEGGGYKWMAGPDITLRDNPGGEPTDKKPEPPPDVPRFSVSTGALQARVHNLLDEEKIQVQKYNEFRDYILSTKDWIFSVSDPGKVGKDGDPYVNEEHTFDPNYWVYQPGANSKVPTPDRYRGLSHEEHDAITSAEDNMLQAVAGALNMMGQITLIFDQVTQAYANTDYHARFPPPPAV